MIERTLRQSRTKRKSSVSRERSTKIMAGEGERLVLL
jgi:hypothetical protein